MVNLKEKMKKIRKYMPLIVGIFWIIGDWESLLLVLLRQKC